MQSEINKASMSRQERDLRSRAAQLISGSGLIHGYLSTRYQVCGKENCRCTRGNKHEILVLVLRREGRSEQIPIPRHLASMVRRWVEQEKTLQELLTEISKLQAQRIRDMKKKEPEK